MAKSRRKPDNVLSLRGAVPAHGVPEPAIVDLLASLMAMAKDGAISGLIVGWVGPSNEIKTRWEGRASSHDLVAASAMLHARIMAAWMTME